MDGEWLFFVIVVSVINCPGIESCNIHLAIRGTCLAIPDPVILTDEIYGFSSTVSGSWANPGRTARHRTVVRSLATLSPVGR